MIPNLDPRVFSKESYVRSALQWSNNVKENLQKIEMDEYNRNGFDTAMNYIIKDLEFLLKLMGKEIK
jgi:hypothetical protein